MISIIIMFTIIIIEHIKASFKRVFVDVVFVVAVVVIDVVVVVVVVVVDFVLELCAFYKSLRFKVNAFVSWCMVEVLTFW